MDLTFIGRRIKHAREAAGITQEALAQAVGCTAKHIGAIEKGIKTPKMETFIIIANTIGVSSDMLLQDLIHYPVDQTACELAAAMKPLSDRIQHKVIKVLRVFSEDTD